MHLWWSNGKHSFELLEGVQRRNAKLILAIWTKHYETFLEPLSFYSLENIAIYEDKNKYFFILNNIGLSNLK